MPTATTTSLADLGVTADQLKARTESTAPATFTTAWSDTPDGDPIAGLVHQTDYRAEEEYGIGDLRKALTGTDPRRFAMTERGRQHAAVFSDVNAIVLSSSPLPDGDLIWGAPISGLPADYAEAWERRQRTRSEYVLDRIAGPHERMDVLRVRARELGIAPLPRRKDDLRAAIAAHPDLASQLPDIWPAECTYGKTLVLRADGDDLTARVVRKLADAVRAGTLGVGSASGPFHSGTFYYDTRDETPQLIAEREAAFDWHDAQMAALRPVQDELKAKGHSWFFLGKPTKRQDGTVQYWLNGMRSMPGAKGRQPYGWYTLEELRAEKFVERDDE